MRKIVSVLSAAVLTLTLCACSSGSSTSSITVAGSTTCLPIAEIAAEGFKEETGIDVLVSGLGSSAGIEAVSAGTADIASSSRGLNADEQDLGLTPIVIAHDGIAVIVNDDNPVDNLSTEQLRDIYAGKITNWKEVGGEDLRIQVINRDEASGTREAFRTIVMDGTPFDRRSAVLSGTGQVRDVVSRSRGAIGYISLGFVDSLNAKTSVKAVSVNHVEASEKTVASGGYPDNVVKGYPITIGELEGVTLYHAGTAIKDKKLVTNGGRVFDVTAVADNLEEARKIVYREIDKIQFKGARYRSDIGKV